MASFETLRKRAKAIGEPRPTETYKPWMQKHYHPADDSRSHWSDGEGEHFMVPGMPSDTGRRLGVPSVELIDDI